MLRSFLDYQLDFFKKGKRLHRIHPLISAVDNFCYEPPLTTQKSPFIRDAVDLKRWMILVVIALIPTIFMAIWNTGLQKVVYSSGSHQLMHEYLQASASFKGYFSFVFKDDRWVSFLKEGFLAFLPIVLISYLAGGLAEGIVACIRKHEIAEGFLVTGMLYPLILPPTIPYWMAAVGIIFGVIMGKELFGGTGMNILNPALTARAFLFFTFPGKMTGDIWAGTNPTVVTNSLNTMNAQAGFNEIDGFTQATAAQCLNQASLDIKGIHVDAIASNVIGNKVSTYEVLQHHLHQWNSNTQQTAELGNLTIDQMQGFITGSISDGGLGLLPSNYSSAHQAAHSIYGLGKFSGGNLFFGNILGSMGETSAAACLLGALFLIYVGIASWRTMAAFGIGAFATAFLFQFISTHFGMDGGAWNPAKYMMPAHRHLMIGGLAFGLVFMATDPVSSPSMNLSKWMYGIMIGAATILIRLVNPAYPEGVMLAILLGNVFAPLIDHYVVRSFRRKARAC